MKADLPANERARLLALAALDVVGSDPSPVLDGIARIVSQLMGTPFALVSLVTEHEQWFKASVGLAGVTSTPRDVAFCAHAILGTRPMVVEDAATDPRFADNPLVTGPVGIRFYAGAPLVTRDGMALGTLCAIDRKPCTPTAEQLATLQCLASVVTALMEAEADRRELARTQAALQHRERLLDASFASMAEGLVVQGADGRIIEANAAAAAVLGLTREQLLGKTSVDPDWRAIHEDGSDYPGEAHPAMVTLRTGEALRNQIMGVRSGGRPLRWISINSTPLRSAGNPELGAVVATFVDVTERQRLSAELHEAKSALEGILNSVPARITSWRTDYTNRFVNHRAAAEFGIDPATAPGMHASQVIGEPRYLRARPYIDAALAGVAQSHDQVDPQKDGSTRLSQVSYIPEIIDGQVVGLFALGIDVTDVRESYRRIQDLSQRLESVRETERRAVALQLHEGIAQDLFAARLGLNELARHATGRAGVLAVLGPLTQAFDQCIRATRELAEDLWPTTLANLNLTEALSVYAARFGRLANLSIVVHERSHKPPLEERVRLVLFRGVQEALTNVARHARATAVEISLSAEAGRIHLHVSDDGTGTAGDPWRKPGSLGLIGLRERFTALGGAVEISASVPHGTILSLSLPLSSPA